MGVQTIEVQPKRVGKKIIVHLGVQTIGVQPKDNRGAADRAHT